MIKHEMQDKIRETPSLTKVMGGSTGLLFALLMAMLVFAWGSDWSGLGDIPERSPQQIQE
jgi:high-affinity Fe2+/Pb2+ permease